MISPAGLVLERLDVCANYLVFLSGLDGLLLIENATNVKSLLVIEAKKTIDVYNIYCEKGMELRFRN